MGITDPMQACFLGRGYSRYRGFWTPSLSSRSLAAYQNQAGELKKYSHTGTVSGDFDLIGRWVQLRHGDLFKVSR